MPGPTPAAIVGIGATEFSKNSGRSELRLAAEAIGAALEDAGIAREAVDGLVTLTIDNNRPNAVARALGLDRVGFFAEVPGGGGGGCATVGLAALAVASGQAEVVVCYRAMNERSQQRLGRPSTGGARPGLASSQDVDQSWTVPFGLATPAAMIGMSLRRYMHTYGVTSEDFGRVAVATRQYAASNPAAWFYGKPITLEDHQSSRLIADPLRLLDCCQESDGAVAIVVTAAGRAGATRHGGVRVTAFGQGMGAGPVSMASYSRPDIAVAEESAQVAQQLWRRSGLTAKDLDVAILYDHFSPAVLMQLEAYGVCGPGEAAAFVRDGQTGPGGALPVNTHGGQLGEAYIHGFNGIAEAVRQLRGTAVNQVPAVEHALVTSGSHVPTSGLLLGKE